MAGTNYSVMKILLWNILLRNINLYAYLDVTSPHTEISKVIETIPNGNQRTCTYHASDELATPFTKASVATILRWLTHNNSSPCSKNWYYLNQYVDCLSDNYFYYSNFVHRINISINEWSHLWHWCMMIDIHQNASHRNSDSQETHKWNTNTVWSFYF